MGTITLQTPTVGQPNSTEDPKITSDFTALQNLLNGNIDTNNISPTAAIKNSQLAVGAGFFSTSGVPAGNNLASGVFYNLPGGATYTLPSPVSGSRVGIYSTFASGTSQCVIAATGGATIFTFDAAGASGVVLGSIGSHMILLANGTNWFVVSGLQDTGWLGIIGLGGCAQNGFFQTASARLIGDRVFLRGGVSNTTGVVWPVGTQFATMPAICRPTSLGVGLSCPDTTLGFGLSVLVNPAGAMSIVGGAWEAGLIFDGCSYTLA